MILPISPYKRFNYTWIISYNKMLVRLKPIDLRMKENSSYIQDHLCSCTILSFYHI